jgi:hypothetical protein
VTALFGGDDDCLPCPLGFDADSFSCAECSLLNADDLEKVLVNLVCGPGLCPVL